MLTECSCMFQRQAAFVPNMAAQQMGQPLQDQVVGTLIRTVGLLCPKMRYNHCSRNCFTVLRIRIF